MIRPVVFLLLLSSGCTSLNPRPEARDLTVEDLASNNKSPWLPRPDAYPSQSTVTAGKPTIQEINDGFRGIERFWMAEYQKTEEKFRYRVASASLEQTYSAIKKAFPNIGMAVIDQSLNKGFVVSESNGPTPLSEDEWISVAAFENPRIKKFGPWLNRLEQVSKDYVVTMKATLKTYQEKTIILLDYRIKNPRLERMGMKPPKVAPPSSVKIATTKFWNALNAELSKAGLSGPRKRKNSEIFL